MSLKCDLNPVFRRKGALLWPPLHPSPHFHPPCLGRRTKVLKRLSTSSLGPHLVGRSKSTWSPLPFLPLPLPPSLTLTPSSICCFLSAPLHEPLLHQLPSPADTSIVLIARLNNWNCVVLWRQNLCLTAECWAESCACNAAPANCIAFCLCSRSLCRFVEVWLYKYC